MNAIVSDPRDRMRFVKELLRVLASWRSVLFTRV